MEVGTFILLGVVLVIQVYATMIYNNLVRLKHNVSQSWSNIDVLLRRRHDQDEWKIVRHSAKLRMQQEFRERAQQPELHILARPEDGRHPYPLSIYPQDRLTRRYRLHAYLSLAGFFSTAAVVAWLLQQAR